MTKRNDHTFAICAYKESPYLEECILSLKNQTVKSNIIMATSTPNEWIQGLAEKYEIPLYINTGEGGIAQDWNFAYRQAKTDYVTIAHQDDIYEPNYLKMIFGELKKGKDPIVVFTIMVNSEMEKKFRNQRCSRSNVFCCCRCEFRDSRMCDFLNAFF